MSDYFSTGIALLLASGIVVAQNTGATLTPTNAIANGSAHTSGKPVATPDENLILKGAELKTDWANARNPFRFEANDSPAYAPERVEQMQVLGFSKMPDETGLLQTYVFVTKTTEGASAQGSEPEGKGTKDIHILRALPEILDERTVTTEEQTEESSITLGSELLWFLGIARTNSQTLAIFIPDNATYPIKEEDLRPFEIQDSLKDLHVRITKAGEKISTEANALRMSARPKTRSTPVKPDTIAPVPPAKPAAPPSPSIAKEKPTIPKIPARPPEKAPPQAGPVR
jgi:hypothetical protein